MLCYPLTTFPQEQNGVAEETTPKAMMILADTRIWIRAADHMTSANGKSKASQRIMGTSITTSSQSAIANATRSFTSA